MRFALAILPMFVVACTHCGEGGSSPDASIEGGVDAAHDGPRDATDSAVGEAGAGWRLYTELPDCSLEVATDPPSVASAIQWTPCPGKGASCEQVDTKGWEQDGTSNSLPWINYARASAGREYLTMLHQRPNNRFEATVYRLPQYIPVQDWMIPADVSCTILAACGSKKAVILQTAPSLLRIASGEIVSTLSSPNFGLLNPPVPPKQNAAYVSLSDTTLSFDIQPNHWVARMPVGQTSYATAKGLKLSEPIVVGDDVFAHHEYGISGWNGLARVNADGSTTGYRYASQRHMSGFRADGNWALWLETFGDPNNLNFDQPNAELWGAPYTNDPQTLASTAKKIATLPGVRTGLGDPAYSDGYYAVYASLSDSVQPTLYVVRVSDGTVKTLDINALVGPDPKHGYYVSRIASVSATEITGILSQVLAAPAFGFVRLQLGPW